MESSSDFTTTILTSKSPQQSASLVNEGVLQTSQSTKQLIQFFESYINLLQKHNFETKNLVSSQAVAISKFLSSQKEFGLLSPIWDQYLQNFQLNINQTDHLIKFLKLEIVTPLINLINNDIKFSEVLINNQELTELATANPIDEYKWNTKAVQILDNFGNFKQTEKNILLQQFVNLFSLINSDLSKSQKLNESALNFTLNNFNIDSEMDNYLNVLVSSNYPNLQQKQPQKAQPPAFAPAGSTTSKKSNRQSKLFGEKDKKEKNKLRSRVGSIFGGKKRKSKKSSDLDSIYSNQTASTNMTNLTNLREEPSHPQESHPVSHQQAYQPPPVSQKPPVSHQPPPQQHSQPPPVSQSSYQSFQPPQQPPTQSQQAQPPQQPQTSPALAPPSRYGTSNNDSTFSYPVETPRKSSTSSSIRNPNRDLPILPPSSPVHEPEVPKSPNVVKYSDSSDDEEGNGPSILQQNNLDIPPPIDTNYLSTNKSTHTQYSFESGDDLKNFQTSPKVQRTDKFELPEPDVAADTTDATENDDTVGDLQTSPSSSVPAPAPPPARKVVHHDRRHEIQSQIFHSLPNTRDSIIEPPRTPSGPSVPSAISPLSSQTTGNSMASKNDMFNHADLLSNLVPGLNISNSQVINVNFKQDNLHKASIIGEVAFNYQGNPTSALHLKIPNKFEKLILNNTFVNQLSQDEFQINPALILNKTLGGIKYMEHSLNISQIPLFIHSIWKFEPHQASLMINLKLNPNFSSSVVLSNFMVSVALRPDVRATSASSRPTGSFNKEKNRITWRYTDPVTLTSDTPDEKLIARFMTNGTASEDDSGIQLKFSIYDHLENSILCDGQPVNHISNMNAGNYNSNS